MDTLHDYVDWIAKSMGIRLTKDQLDNLTASLAVSEDYKKVLWALEERIWLVSGKQKELDEIRRS